MNEHPRDDDETPDTAEPPEAEEDDAPLGSTDDHSDAPGETGTGSREGDPEHGKPYRQ